MWDQASIPAYSVKVSRHTQSCKFSIFDRHHKQYNTITDKTQYYIQQMVSVLVSGAVDSSQGQVKPNAMKLVLVASLQQ